MKISEDEVRYVADLANLRLDETEISRMARELDEILTHVDKLNELDTGDVEAMAQVLFASDAGNTLRADVEHEPLGPDTALENAPLKGAGYFKVPKVIER